jgi:signal peptidase I
MNHDSRMANCNSSKEPTRAKPAAVPHRGKTQPKHRILMLISIALPLLVIVGALRLYYLPVVLIGASMEPGFKSGDFLWMRRAQTLGGPLERHDLVTARIKREYVAKRIVGLPGERIKMVDGRIYVNGEPLMEPYRVLRGSWNIEEGMLAHDRYLLLGDNRELGERVVLLARRSEIIAVLKKAPPPSDSGSVARSIAQEPHDQANANPALASRRTLKLH